MLTAAFGSGLGNDYRFALPIAGPLWTGGELLSSLSSCPSNEVGCVIVGPFIGLFGAALVADGILQAAALGILIGGGVVMGTSKPRAAAVALHPYPVPGGSGLGITLTY